jgi:hypothetical protein
MVGSAVLMRSATASPWPIEASIAYVEEFELACTKVRPDVTATFNARKEFLYAQSPERIKEAMASENYMLARKWARDAIRESNAVDLAKECEAFLKDSNLALEQSYPQKGEPLPVGQQKLR